MKMRKEYDFSKEQENPYVRRLKHQVTIRMDEGTVRYFKELAQHM
jgi:hypothetical protein